MKTIGFHSTKGGVGSTSLTAHACWLARENGIRVAGVSADFTRELPKWLAPLDIICLDGLSGEQPTEDLELLIVDINTQVQHPPLGLDLLVIPIDCRMSYEHAIRLSDRFPGPILWLANHIHAPGFCVRFEIPPYMKHVEQLLPGVSRSHTIAEAGADRKLVWHTPDGACSPGGILLHRALRSVLERAGFELKTREPRPFEHMAALPTEDVSAARRRAHAITAALIEDELRDWPTPRMLDIAGEGLLEGEEDSEVDQAVKRELRGLAEALWDRAGGAPRGRS